MMIDYRNLALNLIQGRPDIGNIPQNREFIEVIRENDSQRGEEIANNLCATYGISKEEALRRAKNFFHIN